MTAAVTNNKMLVINTVITLCFLSIAIGQNVHPAFKLRLTKRGLDYANEVGSRLLNEEIRNAKIPDIYETDVNATNIKITNFKAPTYIYSLTPPSNINWGLNGAGIELTATVRGCKRVVTKICKTLDIRASADEVDIRLGAQFGRNDDGRPKILSANCNATIGKFEFKAKGGLVGWILNLFRGKISQKLKPKIQETICKKAKEFMMKNINAKLASFPVQKKVGELFSVDYGLASDPVINSEFIELALKGEISRDRTPPIRSVSRPTASGIPGNRMFYAWINDKVINDILYLAHLAKRTSFVFDRTTPKLGPYLKFRCDPGKKCLGSEVPDLVRSLSPQTDAAELALSTTSPPVLQIHNNGTASVVVNGTMTLYARISSNGRAQINHTIMVASVHISAKVKVSVENGNITGKVNITELMMKVLQPELDFLTSIQLEAGLPAVLQPKLETAVNKRLDAGLPIPLTKGVRLVDPQIRFLERTLQIESDAMYER